MKQGCLVAVLLALACSAAHAQSSLLSTPYQLALSVGGVLPEDLRGLSPGASARVSLGIPLRPGAYIDANLFGLHAPGEAGSDREKTYGGGLDLRLQRAGVALDYFFLFGGGYSSARRGGTTIDAPYLNIAWGIGRDLTRNLSLRGELRGLARFDQGFIPGRGITYDALASVGFAYKLGAQPRSAATAPAAPPPAPPVEAATSAIEPRGLESTALPAVLLPAQAAAASQVVPRIFTEKDPCPAAPAGAKVDASGCLSTQTLSLPRANFFDSLSASAIKPTGDAVLDAVAASLVKNPALYAEISVHTDSLGFGEDNLKATSELAEQLTRRLYELGAADGRFRVVGRGEEMPRASEETEAGIERNRRVDIRLIQR